MNFFQDFFTVILFVSFRIFILEADCATRIKYNDAINREETLDGVQNCEQIHATYTCVDIPSEIPPKATYVVVKGFEGISLSNHFNDSTWKHVKSLHLTGENVESVADNVFINLGELEELWLSLSSVAEFSLNSFAGLDDLTKIELVDMGSVQVSSISAAFLQPGAIPKLKEFTFNPGILTHPPLFAFSDTLTNSVVSRPLRSLNISNTLMLVSVWTGMELFLSRVEILNVSGSTLVLSSDNGIQEYPSYLGLTTKKPFFQSLDVSRITVPYMPYVLSTPIRYLRGEHYQHLTLQIFMLLIKQLYFNKVMAEKVIIVDSYNFSVNAFFWETISFRSNHLVKINCTWIFNETNNVHHIDLSDNQIEYIWPGFWSTIIHLRRLYLSRNRLYIMQHLKEFQTLFKTFEELLWLDLSFNNISFIPFDMFEANSNLEILDLSSNHLTTIMFGLSNLRSLITLDIRNNRIQFIQGDDLSRLQAYTPTKMNRPETLALNIWFSGNPLLCICESSDFIQWLANFQHLRRQTHINYCAYDGHKLKIDESAIGKCQYLCKKELIIISSVSGSVMLLVVVLVLSLVFVKIRKKRKKVNLEDNFRKDFNGGRLKETYLVFMAYSTLNENIVRKHLLNPTNQVLKRMLKTNKHVVSTGYDFRPGFRITEETYRVLQHSCVFLAVISDQFCKSEYCLAELHEACNQRKPIILLFIGDVDESDMSPYLREVFRRQARAKLTVGSQGEVELVPRLENICESVVSLAIAGKT